jgi:hypothetical protein
MFQRIQTIYIFVATVLIFLLFQLKLADIQVNEQFMTFAAKGIFNGEERVFNGLPLLILVGISAHLELMALFLYKKRIKQIRLLVFNIILLLGLLGVVIYFAYAGFESPKVAFKIPTAFPLVAVILNWLAIRAIGKDEALVRSLDRIR